MKGRQMYIDFCFFLLTEAQPREIGYQMAFFFYCISFLEQFFDWFSWILRPFDSNRGFSIVSTVDFDSIYENILLFSRW